MSVPSRVDHCVSVGREPDLAEKPSAKTVFSVPFDWIAWDDARMVIVGARVPGERSPMGAEISREIREKEVREARSRLQPSKAMGVRGNDVFCECAGR